MEAFVREAAEAHDRVEYTILRFAPVFGPAIGNAISRYLSLPGVPTLLGFATRAEITAAYAEKSGRDLSAIDFYQVQSPSEDERTVLAAAISPQRQSG